MAVVVVGGHSRKVGKTSVAAGIIRAFSRYAWTAIKISPHRHSEEVTGRRFGGEGRYCIYEESDSQGNSDTARFLAAGASRALWVESREDCLGSALEELYPILQSDSFVLIESNAVVRFLDPDLCILVLRCDEEEFKNSAGEILPMADAAIFLGPHDKLPPWWNRVNETLSSKPRFFSEDASFLPEAFIKWIESRLTFLEV